MSSIPEEPPKLLAPAEPGSVQLVQITDCHICADADERLKGINTRRSFETVRAAIIAAGGDLDLLLATGDLSQDGSAESYHYLAQQLDDLGVPTFWLPGNHDNADAMARHLCGKRIHAAKRVLAGAWQILLLDSTVEGEVHGRVAEAELAFMEAALRQYPDRHALICLHHQALETGSEWIDLLGLRDADRLREHIAGHRNIRAVLWGHVHQEMQRSIAGVEWMSTPSSCVQFKPASKEFAIGEELPGFRHLRLNADGSLETRVHRVEYSEFDTA